MNKEKIYLNLAQHFHIPEGDFAISDDSLNFSIDNISGQEGFIVNGQISISDVDFPHETLNEAEIATALFENVEMNQMLTERLFELSASLDYGTFSVNDGLIIYHTSFPIPANDTADAYEQICFVTEQMFNNINGFYPYINICLTEENPMSLDNYITTMEAILSDEQA